jgi:hypothetical protein
VKLAHFFESRAERSETDQPGLALATHYHIMLGGAAWRTQVLKHDRRGTNMCRKKFFALLLAGDRFVPGDSYRATYRDVCVE